MASVNTHEVHYDQLINTGKVIVMAQEIEWISTAEAADLTGYAQHTVAEMCRKGEINCRKFGNSWAVDKQAILTHERDNRGRPKKAV